ncbi:MAG: PaaI family thioesterase [Pseudomonadota bacterium]
MITPDQFPRGGLPEALGMSVIGAGEHWLEVALTLGPHHMRPSIQSVHAGTLVSLADTACGFGCLASLPENAAGFTTIELKTNFLGAAKDGRIVCRAEAEHLGRTTQVWAATVRHEDSGRKLAKFGCTQLIFY